MGVVMGAFSVATVVGVPAGLWMAQAGGWRMPFLAVSALGVVVAAGALFLMPAMRGHLVHARAAAARGYAFLREPAALLSLCATATTMAATFALVPNLAAFLQFNAGLPRERLGFLYMVGGALSFAVLRVVGHAIDRFGAPRVAAVGTAVMLANLALDFVPAEPMLPAWALFVLFILANSFRNPALSTLASRVPRASERARFQSTQSAVQHLASAGGRSCPRCSSPPAREEGSSACGSSRPSPAPCRSRCPSCWPPCSRGSSGARTRSGGPRPRREGWRRAFPVGRARRCR